MDDKRKNQLEQIAIFIGSEKWNKKETKNPRYLLPAPLAMETKNDPAFPRSAEIVYTSTVKLSKMKFDIDWNWIYYVINRIEALGFVFQVRGNSVTIYDSKISTFLEMHGPEKQKNVYNAILKFIEKYEQD